MDEEIGEMWEIVIEIQDGERSYNDSVYYFGLEEDAIRYAESYMNDYFGDDETRWDDHDDCWYSSNGELAATYTVYLYRRIVAMTEKGTFAFDLKFRLA